MKQRWVRLRLRFEASKCYVGKAIASGGLKWQYIAILPDFLVTYFCIVLSSCSYLSVIIRYTESKTIAFQFVADVNATYAIPEINTNITGISDETQSAQNETIGDAGETYIARRFKQLSVV